MTIQEIKAIQISNFLASKGYEPINRKGNKWWYLSPLHTEKTASFKVDLTKNVWYDFALGKGGNINSSIYNRLLLNILYVINQKYGLNL